MAGKSLRERLKCEADVPDKAIKPLLQLYHRRTMEAGHLTMDAFVESIKRKAKKR